MFPRSIAATVHPIEHSMTSTNIPCGSHHSIVNSQPFLAPCHLMPYATVWAPRIRSYIGVHHFGVYWSRWISKTCDIIHSVRTINSLLYDKSYCTRLHELSFHCTSQLKWNDLLLSHSTPLIAQYHLRRWMHPHRSCRNFHCNKMKKKLGKVKIYYLKKYKCMSRRENTRRYRKYERNRPSSIDWPSRRNMLSKVNKMPNTKYSLQNVLKTIKMSEAFFDFAYCSFHVLKMVSY